MEGGWLKPNQAVAILFVLYAISLIVYDVWALAFRDETWTITFVLKDWSMQFPILPLVFGVLMGHLFFCQNISMNRPLKDSVKEEMRNNREVGMPEAKP